MTNQEINEAVARKLGREFQGTWEGNYCHSIEKAWEIVEWLKINKPNWHFSMFCVKDWACTVGIPGDSYSGYASTASMAICRAFLKSEDIVDDCLQTL